ncbi:cytosine/adenosine deaminase-related metal-dependent hydrolase [Paraburkholderia terricola]|uniref:hypothetical protein n=1 Tax=Paraburkholderia terricola TaxID=169427 RepID=UPI00285F51A9|nr:hypothetical protein [Paraburkholderia terricola]MDR6496460.1 cytosine/adenosine deaminase-related metal-dependent hydrolase [Paraburkholderia terricola]
MNPTAISNQRLWLRSPLAILSDNADGGIVIEGTTIVEKVPSGATPSTPVDSVFDASNHVVIPGLISKRLGPTVSPFARA